MKKAIILFACVTTLTRIQALGQSNTSGSSSISNLRELTGVWRGRVDGLPALDLVVSDECSGLCGAVLFYFHERQTEKDPWVSKPGLPEPILNPRFDGKTLRFEVSHQRAHPPRTLTDSPVSFQLTLMGADRAELRREKEAAQRGGPPFVLVRSDH